MLKVSKIQVIDGAHRVFIAIDQTIAENNSKLNKADIRDITSRDQEVLAVLVLTDYINSQGVRATSFEVNEIAQSRGLETLAVQETTKLAILPTYRSHDGRGSGNHIPKRPSLRLHPGPQYVVFRNKAIHITWTQGRGETRAFGEFYRQNFLYINNVDGKSIIVTVPAKTSNIDVTLPTRSVQITSWKVIVGASLNDHKFIEFAVSEEMEGTLKFTTTITKYWDRGVNWERCRAYLEKDTGVMNEKKRRE
ncbi:hypothetical protein EVAR_45504_1 [Eumeta japonica]|uniref:Uncharacterized protein n=1 Tax=Eumeta variegata TaxID=151549 RepID=A0A4C1WDT6_EUMVA|nr:hypothetical protein EVAR_45504_1 [Eumeta japonica]